MSKAIKLSDELVSSAQAAANATARSLPKQIEYWAKIGRIAIENPDLPYSFIEGVLLGIEEIKAGDFTEYKFG